jgi:hypothetical protein
VTRWALVLCGLAVAAGCEQAESEGTVADASVVADAATEPMDAATESPDGAVRAADAGPSPADGGPLVFLDGALAVDAAPSPPDAEVVPPDAAPPEPDIGPLPPVTMDDCLPELVRVGDLWVFPYEASRTDAAAGAEGEDTGRACSVPGVVPWVRITVEEADAACQASGMRLCSGAEWQLACDGGVENRAFPYGEIHRPGVCNDHVSGSGTLETTGNREDCVTADGLYDMSGNVWELTRENERRGASYRINAIMFRVDSARCDNPFAVEPEYTARDVGFRCCLPVR